MRLAMLLPAVLALALTGCHAGREQIKAKLEVRKITLETVPSGATVHQISALDGSRTFLGTTPISNQSVAVCVGWTMKNTSPAVFQQRVSQLEMVQVLIEKKGYKPYCGQLSTEREGKVAVHKIDLEQQ